MGAAPYVRITSTDAVAATAMVRGGFLVRTESAVINGASIASAANEANFPHVINGELTGANYITLVGVTNLSSSPQTVTLTFTPDNGTPVSKQRQLDGNGALLDAASNLFALPQSFQGGWVKVSGTAPITGFAAYADIVAGQLAVVPVSPARNSLLFAPSADGPPWETGLAFLNTGNSAANLEIYALAPDGQLIGSARNITVPAGRKAVDLLHKWISPVQGRNGGFVFVRTTNNVPLFGIELFYTTDQRILSNVSAGTLVPGIQYTPPGSGR